MTAANPAASIGDASGSPSASITTAIAVTDAPRQVSQVSSGYAIRRAHAAPRSTPRPTATAAGTTMPRSISLTVQNGVGLEAYSIMEAGSVQAVTMVGRCSPSSRKAAAPSSVPPAARASRRDGAGGCGDSARQASTSVASASRNAVSSSGKNRSTLPGRRRYSWPMTTCAYV
ncbi:hypothetical protein QLR68_20685 [Micromonospora sp. DH15]|nr:hypothetical protein [Micromonospora sp. DH15]